MQKTKGSGLIFAVILLFVILAMVVTLSSVTVLETKMSQKTKSSVGAFYNSESGVEWALNQIATTTNPTSTTAASRFGIASGNTKATCPAGFGCEVYFLKQDGTVADPFATNVSDIKAVRSVGTQNTGEVTQRAIEAAVAAGDFPQGGIIMWSGIIAKIPPGWALCDGNNGTPDLRSSFVYGAPAGIEPGTKTLVYTYDRFPMGSGSVNNEKLVDPLAGNYYTVAFIIKL